MALRSNLSGQVLFNPRRAFHLTGGPALSTEIDMETDWDKVRETAYESIKRVLAAEDKSFLEGSDELRALAGRIVGYWKEEAEGGILTGNLLSAVEYQARLLCTLYGVDGRGKAVKIQKLIRLFVDVGAVVVEILRSHGKEDK